MSAAFDIAIYSNPVRGNALLQAHWGKYAEALTFSTNAFGGYASCTFQLRLGYDEMRSYVLGFGQPAYATNRIRITDPFGVVCYEGILSSLSVRAGSEIISCGVESLYNCVRVDYDVPYKNRTVTKQNYFDDATSRAAYGKKVMRLQLPGAFPANTTTPRSVARRFIKQRRQMSAPSSKRKGGEDTDLVMEVSCVGMSAPALEWRYAFSNLATSTDSANVVKDMLAANPITEGSTGAFRGRAGSGWGEVLDANGYLGFGQQFIHPSNFNNIAASGTSVERNIGSGSTRIEIVKQAAQYGSSSDKRMLFQVWDDGATNAGKGIAYFQAMNETKPLASGYTGYYDYPHVPQVFNAGMTRLPLWRVRAGNWMTTLGLGSFAAYATIYDDPRCFWIEETAYDVDRGVLTLSTSSDFNLEQYLGRLIGGKKVITDVL